MFKKLFNATLALAILAQSTLVAVPSANAATYLETQGMAYDWAVANNITAVTDGLDSFKGAVPFLGRQNWAKYIVEFAKKYYPDVTADTSKVCEFSDLNFALNDVIRDYIVEACQMNLMNGYAGTDLFGTRDLMTRGQIFVTIFKLMNGGTVPTSNPFRASSFSALNDAGIATVDNGAANIAGIDAMIMLMRASETEVNPLDPDLLLRCLLNPEDPACVDVDPVTTGTNNTGMNNTGVVNEVKAGTLDLSIVPSTKTDPVSIPSNGTVNFGSIRLSAAVSDVTVRSLTLTRRGLGQRTDVSAVFLERDGVRVSSRNSVTVDGTVILSLTTPLTIKAGGSEVVDVIVSMNGDGSNSQHRFEVAESSNIDSSAQTVVGNFPVTTLTHVTTSYTVTPVTLKTEGVDGNSYKFGDTQVEIGSFSVTNDSTEEREVSFKGVTLRSSNSSAITNLRNIKLYKNGAVISTNGVFNGRDLTITLDDTLLQGRTQRYYIKADVAGVEQGDGGDNYTFTVRNNEDLNVIEVASTFKANVDFDPVANQLSLKAFTIKGGDVTVSRPISLTSSMDVSRGQTDTVLMSATVVVEQGIKVDGVELPYLVTLSDDVTAGSGLNEFFSTLRLRVNGSIRDTFTAPVTANGTVLFTNEFDLVKGTYTIDIIGNVRDSAPVDQKIKLSSDFGSGTFKVNEFISADTSGIPQIAGTSTPLRLTVKSSELTLSVIGSDNTVVKGAQQAEFLRFNIAAGNNSKADITRITLNGNGASFTSNLFSNLKLFKVDGNVMTELKTASVNGSNVIFDSFGTTSIPAGQTQTFVVKANVSTNALDGSTIQLSIPSNGVVATDASSRNYSVAGVTGRLYTITDLGSVRITMSSTNPVPGLYVAGGSTMHDLAQINVVTQKDTINLTDLILTNNAAVTPMVLQERVSNIGLYSGTQLIANGTVIGSFVRFNLSDVRIPKDTQNTIFVVRASFASSTQGTDFDNGNIQLAVAPTGYETLFPNLPQGIFQGVRAISDSVGDTLGAGFVAFTANLAPTHRLVPAKPIISVSDVVTNDEPYTMNITAVGGKVDISSLTFASNGTLGLAIVEINGVPYSTAQDLDGIINMDLANNLEIDEGQTATIIVKAQTTLGSAQTRSVRLTDVSYDAIVGGNTVSITSIGLYFNNLTSGVGSFPTRSKSNP